VSQSFTAPDLQFLFASLKQQEVALEAERVVEERQLEALKIRASLFLIHLPLHLSLPPSLYLLFGISTRSVLFLCCMLPNCTVLSQTPSSGPYFNCMPLLRFFPRVGTVLHFIGVGLPSSWVGTVRVFRLKFTLEDAIGSHACLLEALACVRPMELFISGVLSSYRLVL
jgi:hypothetical protein